MNNGEPIMDRDRAEINRTNARRSTGPTTPAGLARSSMNALRHGLTAEAVILPDEAPEDFQAFTAELVEDLRPEGHLESMLAMRVATAAWRLRRILRAEAGMFARYDGEAVHEVGNRKRQAMGLAFIQDGNGPDAFSKLSRYETAIERGMTAALHELQRLQGARNGQGCAMPVALDMTLNTCPLPAN